MGVSVLSQLRLCQALAKACDLDERNCCQNLLGSRKGLILFSFQSWGAGTQLGQPSLPSRVLQRGRCPLLSLEGSVQSCRESSGNLHWQNSSCWDRSFPLSAVSLVREMHW